MFIYLFYLFILFIYFIYLFSFFSFFFLGGGGGVGSPVPLYTVTLLKECICSSTRSVIRIIMPKSGISQ